MMLKSYKQSLVAGVLLAGLAVPFGAPAFAADYKIDLSHSFIEFRTKHLGYSWLSGRFNKFEGTMQYDPDAGPTGQSIELTIDTTSIDSNWAERDKHLRSGDFFNVEDHPTATFKSTKYEGDADGGTLTGKLNLLGQSKTISFPIKKIGEGNDPWGGYRAGFEGIFLMARSDFGMQFNLGSSSEEVEIGLFIEGIRQ
jgi:polyisoprenoid-binding protein YceI